MEPIIIDDILINTPKGPRDILSLFNNKSIIIFIRSCILNLRDGKVKDTDTSITPDMFLTPDKIHHISVLLSECSLPIKNLEHTFEIFIQSILPRYFSRNEKTKKIVFYPNGDNQTENFTAEVIASHLHPTKENIKLLLSLYLLYQCDNDVISNCINDFNNFFLEYYDVTDHTRELLIEFQDKNVLTKYITPQRFYDSLSGTFYTEFTQKQAFPYLMVGRVNRGANSLGIFQIEMFIDSETGTQNINFSIVNDEVYYNLKREVTDENEYIPCMYLLEWYTTNPQYKHFIDTIFEKALFDFSIYLKRTSKKDFTEGKFFFSADVGYNVAAHHTWHKDETLNFPVEYFTLGFMAYLDPPHERAKTAKSQHAFVGTGVAINPTSDGHHNIGYFSVSNQVTLGIDNNLLIHTGPDTNYELFKKKASTQKTRFNEEFNPTGENRDISFTELRGNRLTREVQEEAANLLFTNTQEHAYSSLFTNSNTTSDYNRNFIRLWFTTFIPETFSTSSSNEWRQLKHPLFCESFRERCIDTECFEFIKSATQSVSNFELITIKRCVLNTSPEEKHQAKVAADEMFCSEHTCTPFLESDKGHIYCDTYIETGTESRPRQLNNIGYKMPKTESGEFILFDDFGISTQEESSLKPAAKALSGEEDVEEEEDDIVDMICKLLDNVNTSAVKKHIDSIEEIEEVLPKVAMGKKSKKHKTKKHKKFKKSKTKKIIFV
jgi:hypothetical protein